MVKAQTIRNRRYLDVEYFERQILNERNVEIKSIRKRSISRFLNVCFVALTIFISVYFAITCFQTLSYRLSLIYKQKYIRSLEIELDKQRKVNDLLEEEIKHMISEDYIRKVAILKLSMFVPNEKDIIYFDKSNNSYVRQYGNVK